MRIAQMLSDICRSSHLQIICPILVTALLLQAFGASSTTNDAPISVLLERYSADPGDANLCEQIGIAYTHSNDFNKAATFFKKALDLNPQGLPAAKNLGTVLWFAGRKQESAAVFEALARRIPNDPVPQLYLGLSAYDSKNMGDAALHFEHAGLLASDNPELLPVVVDSYLSTGRFGPAASILEHRIESGESSAQIYRWLGDAYDGESLPDKAHSAYSKAIDAEPNEPDNYLALAGFCIQHANLPTAREVLNRGLQRTPTSSRLRLELGLAWALQGDFSAAKQKFLDASQSDPNWALPLLALGVTELQTGNADQAAECFRKAKLIEPKAYYCYYLHGLALTRTERIQQAATAAEALAELRRAIALDPRQIQPRVLLAETETTRGELKEAEADFRQALRLDPNDATALYRLGLLFKKEGKTAEAEHLLTEFRTAKSKSHDEENEYVLIMKTIK